MNFFIKKDKTSENYFFKTLFDLYSKWLLLKVSLIILLAIILLDKYNIPSFLYNELGAVVIIVFLILVAIKFFELKTEDLIRFKTVNYLDASIFETAIIFLVYNLYIIIIDYSFGTFKSMISVVVLLLSLAFLLGRYLYIGKCWKENRNNNKNTNVYDLIDLYNNKIKLNNDELIYIDEKDVNYDLLHREIVIRNLYNVLINCKTNSKFVISLNGSWGSGKTTLINNVKRELNDAIKENKELESKLIIIDDFDPWIYEGQDSLFRGLFDVIINKLGMNFSIAETKKIIKNYLNMIFSNTKIKIDLSNYYNPQKEVERLRKMINSYMEINDKRLVIIIDNIERANRENVIFLFKIISTVLNFNRTIYLLSFDKEQMKKIFIKETTDYEYMEKIIQMEVNVPNISPNDINDITLICFENLLKLYGAEEKNIASYEEIIKLIIKDIKDVRGIKRTINSVFNINEYSNNYLNKLDALALEMISIKNPKLYKSIYENRVFYISEDYSIFDFDYVFSNEKFNKDATDYFIELFNDAENKKYIGILSLLFPYVKKFAENTYRQVDNNTLHIRTEFRQESHSYIVPTDKLEYAKNIKEKRIFNARFFDLYFTYAKNEFIAIDIKIKEFIFVINNKSNYNVINNKYLEVLSLFDNFIQKYSLETLEYYLENIKKDKYFILLKIIYNNINIVNDDSNIWFGLDAKSRAEYIISELINLVSDEEREKFINYIKNDFKNLKVISSIVYWLNPEKQYQRNLSDKIYNEFMKVYDNIKQQIKVQKINLYNRKYYSKHNVYCFSDDVEMLNQIGDDINKNNVLLFLKDMIRKSSGTNGYGYRINRETSDKIIPYKKVKEIIKKINLDELGEKEKFITSVFEKSEDIDEDKGTIYLKEPFSL